MSMNAMSVERRKRRSDAARTAARAEAVASLADGVWSDNIARDTSRLRSPLVVVRDSSLTLAFFEGEALVGAELSDPKRKRGRF